MSWFATKYAWRLSSVDKSAKMVLLALAYRIPNGYSSTEPTSLSVIEEMTGYDPRHLRRCLDELAAAGEVVRLTRGKLATYHFQNMEGPLFAHRTEKPDAVSAFPQSRGPDKPDALSENDSDNMSEKNRTHCPVGRGVSFSSEVLSTKVRTSTTERKTAVVDRIAHVHEFLDWWVRVYPAYNDGAKTTVDLETHGPIVLALLEQRPLGRLKAMAVTLWLVDAREERWIAVSDRSIHVLRHKADWLDRRLTQVAEWWVACQHTPKCSSSVSCEGAEVRVSGGAEAFG